MWVAEDDPQSRPVHLVPGTDGTSKLSQFERKLRRVGKIQALELHGTGMQPRMSQEFHQHSAGVVDEIAKTLRNENGVNIARSGLLELQQIVIRERFFERNLNRRGRLVFVGNDADGHGLKVLHQRGYFG